MGKNYKVVNLGRLAFVTLFFTSSIFVLSCSSGARKSKMSAQFKKIQQDVVVIETTPEPAPPEVKPETEVLRILAENNFDTDKAVEESTKQGVIVEAPPELAQMVQEVEKKVELQQKAEQRLAADTGQASSDLTGVTEAGVTVVSEARKIASAESSAAGVCVPWHPALKRMQSHRMKTSTFEVDRQKFYDQIQRSYKDMGGVELSSTEVAEGVTLQQLSLQTFGTSVRWPEIYLLNKDVISHYDMILKGLTVQTPKLDWSNEKHCERSTVGMRR